MSSIKEFGSMTLMSLLIYNFWNTLEVKTYPLYPEGAFHDSFPDNMCTEKIMLFTQKMGLWGSLNTQSGWKLNNKFWYGISKNFLRFSLVLAGVWYSYLCNIASCMPFLPFIGIGEQNIAYITADREKLQQALNRSTSGKYSCFIRIPL